MYFEKLMTHAHLADGEAARRQQQNTDYLLELKTDNLLFPYRWQAGDFWSINRRMPELHGGWDSQNSHIRGTFTGHWLSAAAHIYAQTQNREMKNRADFIVDEIKKCQTLNGGQWAFPIPADYIEGVKQGRRFWAPLYVCHKVMMGLLDVYLYMDNPVALDIIDHASDWFVDFTGRTTREQLTEMMDIQETGGIMELWADLYGVTGIQKYLDLMRAFERPALFEPLLGGKDVLTNMHANTTIPEAHGAARAYEVTGEERYRKIVENYWDWAVTKRGMYATGGQTCGEVWTPPMRQSARLGEQNQEHCTVYNMIRLADYLYRWTGKTEYADYIERNILNGLYTQGYWNARELDCLCDPTPPDFGLVAYYLPLHAGAQKKWGSKTDHFWCCHCTLVQANSRLREFIWYRHSNSIALAQYIPSDLTEEIDGRTVQIQLCNTDLGGSCNRINETALNIRERPACYAYDLAVKADEGCAFELKVRIPWWIAGKVECTVNGKAVEVSERDGYLVLNRCWQSDTVHLVFPKTLTCWPLADEPETVAFLDGPVVLAGLVGEERTLYGDVHHPETLLKPHCERVWSEWTADWKTTGQPVNFYLKPIAQIGREHYTVYFPIEPKR